MAERTAHNGLVAGSNPAKPKILLNYKNLNMSKNFKKFKLYKIKQDLKTQNIVFFFHTTNLKTINWLKIEQEFFKSKLECYKINNSVTHYALKNSAFFNFSTLINGEMCVIYLKTFNSNLNMQKFNKIDKTMHLMGMKLNKKFYTKQQLNTISTLDYNTNINIFTKIMKKLLKLPYYKFKK